MLREGGRESGKEGERGREGERERERERETERENTCLSLSFCKMCF